MSTKICLIVGLLVFAAATVVSAAPPATQAAAPPPAIKAAVKSNQPPPVIRLDGDTLEDPYSIHELPYHDTRNSSEYNDDYIGSCVESGGAPDVVYRFTADTVPPDVDGVIVSVCGSGFDTSLYIYDAGLNEIACNDDFCDLQSQLTIPVSPGETYYFIVDGYSEYSGEYVIDVQWRLPCVLIPPKDAGFEGEPPLVDDYVDLHNGGCNSPPDLPFQAIWGAPDDSGLPAGSSILCGVGGWYLSGTDSYRDTDWYTLAVGTSGVIEITVDAEYETLIFELGPLDCATANIVQQAAAGPCAEAFLTINDEPGVIKWLWVGASGFESPDGTREYDYTIWFDGLSSVGTTTTTLGAVKALYR